METNLKFKPRVGIDARPFAYGMTGNSRYLHEVLKKLIHFNSPFEYYLYSHKEFHPVFEDVYESPLIKVSVYDKFQIPGFLWLNYILPKELKEDRVDIFWGTLQMLPFFKMNIPEVVNYHDLNFISAPNTMTKANYFQHKIFSPITLRHADKIFCLSKNTKNDIHQNFPRFKEKLTVIYPGVNQKTEGLHVNPPYDNFLFTIGTLEPRKNLKTLILAYIQLKTENPNFPLKLIVAGRVGWKEKELSDSLLKGEYEKFGLYFLQNPDDDVLTFLYKNCYAFLFPSIHEGFGLPLLEALIENKICVASDIPVFREVLTDEDIFVEPLNIINWKEALLKIEKENLNKRKKVWNREDWSWDKSANSIEKELNSIWKKKIDRLSF
ncbi:MAG: glycosyltransferase family 4 protein [Leptospiraceae bacterium]|nr:glycosyltransferase family 4 protein [Leptospiraceae bacterium]MCK6382174.1 glycosyltransferase family 4 protein [Leptospiraceae bacterium]NUM40995.1 glycosyltransferase family 4 protein [Leptospiraceae bacterium]